ncbi:uncharacterized protein LOC124875325 isoform X2 [Girardinichthys multiradiatus]|uniref:uncharacterized protein LOC124875325 isoform X2 n=1 Tax=Girardinichthys multiradiatus TaxID=208333 RepID=UPI001FAC9983|nr:uncharacterized protein LOC124875325 isoform X2 [Girardinichthys multiradiatus]
MMKVKADIPRGLRVEPPIPAASTSEPEQKQDSKDLIHQMLVIKVVPHDWSPSLDQQDPGPPHVKEEDEELWISQEEEQLSVKSEDEEKPQLSELHQGETENNRETEAPTSSSVIQMEREPDGQSCGGLEPDKNPDPVCSSHLSKKMVERRGLQVRT